MDFLADLHVHSKFSRATSRDLDLEHLAWWAARKGIAVVGTGDCVHPGWLVEIRDKLVPSGCGLFRLKPDIEDEIARTLPPSCRRPVQFMLSTEISTIYKKGERTRKVHHLIYAPDLETVERLAASLARIGNIASDGRPILGLDSRDLFEIALESGPDAYLVPAHIWTPWFAALGSQSGFDTIEECYGDLADNIFAVETGLSSDPAMNWRVSFLDRYRLTSNSDAHSPGKLGREATRFSCTPDYFSIRRALETGDGYSGTIEFFPEEGKYHLDGHRACGVRQEPMETLANGGRCPVCGGKLTIGVAHRVERLADRSEAEAVPPPTAGTAASLVPLPEILSEILATGVASQTVKRAYDRATAALGPELSVLEELPTDDIAHAEPMLAEAVTRLRAGTVIREAGYDGEYGVIRLFEDDELDRLNGTSLLFDTPRRQRKRTNKKTPQPVLRPEPAAPEPAPPKPSGRSGVLAKLDADQALAAETIGGPLVVLAGPGSGKTRMLTHRLAHLVLECGVPAAACLAVTFTRRATAELKQRLSALLPPKSGQCAVLSFHALGLQILRAHGAVLGLASDVRVADERERRTALAAAMSVTQGKAARLLKAASLFKRSGAAGNTEAREAAGLLRGLSIAQNWVDFDDLVGLPAEILEADADVATQWRSRFQHIAIDEFQDVDEQQYRLIRLLAPAAGDVCVIGDPNQAIYGFRGADATCFARFRRDFPTAPTLRLGRNYRSTGTIATAAAKVIGSSEPAGITRPMADKITVYVAPDERAEATFVASTIETLIGGHNMLTANGDNSSGRAMSFADFAVLYRTDAQSAVLRTAFDEAGIPFKKSSPAPISDEAAVPALLAALAHQAGGDIRARLAAAADTLRGETDVLDAASISEALHWLVALAKSEAVAGDETRLREQAALSNESDFWDARADRVSLTTMHAAKGLEFAVVFVVGMENGLMPFTWGASEGDEAETNRTEAEERRLFYVAVTRAKDRLYLSRAVERMWRGERRALPPSPFLSDIAPELIEEQRPAKQKPRADARQYSLF